MSEFFDSDMVQQTMQELEELQKKLLIRIFDIPYCSKEEKQDYIKTMREYMEKQKVLLFRMSLSNDPEAIETKQRILESAKVFGLKDESNINEFFDMLEKPINELEKTFGL